MTIYIKLQRDLFNIHNTVGMFEVRLNHDIYTGISLTVTVYRLEETGDIYTHLNINGIKCYCIMTIANKVLRSPSNFLAPPILIKSCVVHVIRTRVSARVSVF